VPSPPIPTSITDELAHEMESFKDEILLKDPLVVAAEILTRKSVWNNLHLYFEEKKTETGERIHCEMWNGDAWRNTQQKLGIGKQMAPFIIFADGG